MVTPARSTPEPAARSLAAQTAVRLGMPRPSLHGLLLLVLCLALAPASLAQNAGDPVFPAPTITVRSSLVLVPALVKTRGGELVFTLTADDFTLTDDGVPQRLRLETDTDRQPLSLVVVVQTGGLGATHLKDYGRLDATLDAVIGDVRHRVALVRFDSEPHLEQPFTPRTAEVSAALADLEPGDHGAAILDSLRFAVELLRKEPPSYRRAILLLSETIDSGSESTLEEAIRAVDDTNTSIYSFGFSSTRSALKHEVAKLPRPGKPTPYQMKPYPAGGCMSREPDADPDAHGDRKLQALDCAEDLLPPLRIARLAFLAARDSMERNVPETVARLTGGEYFAFKDARSLARGLVTISNDVPNHYVLSFVPSSPHAGLHALQLQLKQHPEFELRSRSAFWLDAPSSAPAAP